MRRASASDFVSTSAGNQDSDLWEERSRSVRWSSGVAFRPHPKYWLIGGKYYDLVDFLPRHPGGEQLLRLARDRFDDCTYTFEAHHTDYQRARAVLAKYEVKSPSHPDQARSSDRASPAVSPAVSQPPVLVENKFHVKLLDDEAFYSVLRKRVHLFLKTSGGAGPTSTCIALFWMIFSLWAALWIGTLRTGSLVLAVCVGLVGAVLGGFGHNWVHQPKYRLWAVLSLDTLGFSSEAWLREHLLQHHMYTNTPKDNHFKGTGIAQHQLGGRTTSVMMIAWLGLADPWFVTDPTVPRNFFQRQVTPFLLPLMLSFGAFANYLTHTVNIVNGQVRARSSGPLCTARTATAGLHRPRHSRACRFVPGASSYWQVLLPGTADPACVGMGLGARAAIGMGYLRGNVHLVFHSGINEPQC